MPGSEQGRQGPAKPRTAVRFRPPPLVTDVNRRREDKEMQWP
jgi:hypothetical protein